MGTEVDIQNLIRIALSEKGIVTWRNNTFALKDPATGRLVRGGLCTGSADIIGIMPDGRFLAIEVKKPGKKPTKEQTNFLRVVNEHGGIGVWMDSVEGLEVLKDRF